MTYLTRSAAFRHQVKMTLENACGIRWHRRQKVHGLDAFDDLQRFKLPVETVIDVGANVGQFTTTCRERFPNSKIYCFEPQSDAFKQLQTNVRHPLTTCHRYAAGEAAGNASLFVTGNSTTHSLVRPSRYVGSEEIDVVAIDEFANTQEISRVDLLKIDTEGFELQVLEGAKRLLAEGRIGAVYAEVGFHPGDRRHTLFDDVRELLINHGFAVLGFYSQTPEWSGQARLRFADSLMVRLG